MADAFQRPLAPTRFGFRFDGFWLAALAAGAAAGLFNVNFILAHFYHNGPYMLDSGYLATLVYRTTPLLPNPVSFGPGSWLSTHITPLLYLLSIPSNWVDWPLPDYYALTQGFIYGLVAFAGALCSRPLLASMRGGPVIAALFGLGLGFSGVTLAAVGYPHYECLFCGWAILFLALLLQGNWRWAAGPFALALLVREDCGLHLFGILLLLLGVAWVIPEWRPRRRTLAVFMALALGYSLLAIFFQKLYFPGDDALHRIYLGDPLFSHLTGAALGQRLNYQWTQGKYIWVPHCLLLGVAIWRRSLVLLCGFAAFLPWVAFNFLAKSELASELYLYYSFPLIIAQIWPALTYAADPRRLPPAHVAVLQAVILGVSTFFFANEHPRAFNTILAGGLSFEGFHQADYRKTRDFVLALSRQTNHRLFDVSVAALFPNNIARANWENGVPAQTPDIIVGFKDGPESEILRTYALSRGPWHEYSLSWLPLYILSKQPLPAELFPAEGVNDIGELLDLHSAAPATLPK